MNTPQKYNQQCVCQICTCGKHRCPKAKIPFQGETTHHHDFKGYHITPQRPLPCTHHYHQRHYDSDALKTSYDRSYRPYTIQNPGNRGTKYEYKPRSGKFYGDTEYSTSYKNNQIIPSTPQHCTHQYKRNPAKFQGQTTYTSQFKPKIAESSYRPSQFTYQRRKVPFEGKTTYDDNYVPHQLEPNPEYRHVCECDKNRKRVKFEGQSNYKTNYKAYQITHEPHCPILNMPEYPRQCSPGKRHVNYSAEKNNWE